MALGDHRAVNTGSSGFPQGPTGSALHLGHCWSPTGISHHSQLFQGPPPPAWWDSTPTRTTVLGAIVCWTVTCASSPPLRVGPDRQLA